MGTRRKPVLAAAVVILGLAIGGFAIAHFVGAREGGVKSGERLPLLTANRTYLSVCVDGAVGYTVTNADVDTLRQALDGALDSFPDTPAEFKQRDVALGCPPPPEAIANLGTKEVPNLADGEILGGISVQTPGPHRLLVYLVAPEDYAATSTLPYVIGNGQVVFEGHVGNPVSSALYISPSIAPPALREALLAALNLQVASRPQPTLDWQACELGTPAPWCVRYEEHRRGELDE